MDMNGMGSFPVGTMRGNGQGSIRKSEAGSTKAQYKRDKNQCRLLPDGFEMVRLLKRYFGILFGQDENAKGLS